MRTLNDIYDKADIYGVKVISYDISGLEAASVMAQNGNCGIVVDPLQLTSELDEKVKVTLEVGHCVCGAFYNRYSELDIIERHEYRANKWAVYQLMPWEDLRQALEQGIIEIWELAEYFDVTEDFVHTARAIYRNQLMSLEYE